MNKIQNIACIQATISPDDRRISLNRDVIRGKKILGIYLFACTASNKVKSPFKDEFIALNTELKNISLYANLQDVDGHLFIKDYAAENMIVDTEVSANNRLFEYDINRILDLDTSYISYKGTLSTSLNLLIYVSYQVHNFAPYTDEVEGSVTYTLPVDAAIQDIRLVDVVNYTLREKPIRQIIIRTPDGAPVLGYLDIIYSGGKLDNVPAPLFQIRSTKEFLIDAAVIDFEKSYYRHRALASQLIKITFIY